MMDAFRQADQVLLSGVQGISDLTNSAGSSIDAGTANAPQQRQHHQPVRAPHHLLAELGPGRGVGG